MQPSAVASPPLWLQGPERYPSGDLAPISSTSLYADRGRDSLPLSLAL